jgi:hypothetical protein
MSFNIYSKNETTTEALVLLPVENLKTIQQNLKNAKADKRNRNSNML